MKHTLGLALIALAVSGCSSNDNMQNGTMGSGGQGGLGTGGMSGAGSGTGGTLDTGVPGMGTQTGTGGMGMTQTGSGGAGAGTGTGGMGGGMDVAGMGGGSAGMGMDTGSGGMDMTDGSGGTGGQAASTGFKPPCLTKGSQLVTIGDSWINYTERLTPELTSRAIADGALPQGDSYGEYAVPGTSLYYDPTGLLLIPPQWDQAVADDPDRPFVVMDGGGNDVLLWNQQCLGDGSQNDTGCQDVVSHTMEVGHMLEMTMKSQGVHEVIYFFYPHVPAGGSDISDYSIPMAKAACEGMNDDQYKCIFVDTRDAFDPNHTGVAQADLIGSDGIHPTAAGEKVLADLIWQTMKDNCMAQPESSGCCTPQ